MRLELLRLTNFRNIAQASLPFGPDLNLFYGGNGQGKSNLLEAIGLLATGRSFRKASSGIMRRVGTPWFLIHGRSRSRNLTSQLDFFGKSDRQVARLNGKPMRALSDLGETLAAVIFSSDLSRLIWNGPSERRRYLDHLIFMRDRFHAERVRDFQRTLRSRTELLRRRAVRPEELSAWEERIAALGAAISVRRRERTRALVSALTPNLKALGLDETRFHILFRCQLNRVRTEHYDWREEEAVSLYRAMLLESRVSDRKRGISSIGPHRDDCLFLIEDQPLQRFGSQGEQKRFLLALKLAEADLLKQQLDTPPLFLMDDPVSELDAHGIHLVMSLLKQRGHQLFITTCQPKAVPCENHTTTRFSVTAGDFQHDPSQSK